MCLADIGENIVLPCNKTKGWVTRNFTHLSRWQKPYIPPKEVNLYQTPRCHFAEENLPEKLVRRYRWTLFVVTEYCCAYTSNITVSFSIDSMLVEGFIWGRIKLNHQIMSSLRIQAQLKCLNHFYRITAYSTPPHTSPHPTSNPQKHKGAETTLSII